MYPILPWILKKCTFLLALYCTSLYIICHACPIAIFAETDAKYLSVLLVR